MHSSRNKPARTYGARSRQIEARPITTVETEAEPASQPDAPIVQQPAPSEQGILARAGLVVVLSLTLVGAMRWALGVTNANARQISTNLTQIQDRYDSQTPRDARKPARVAPNRPALGPVIEPEEKR